RDNSNGQTQFYYQSSADVTALVQRRGPGAYRVGGIASVTPVNRNDNTWFAAWGMVVFYHLPTDPPRNLALFDGAEMVAPGNSSSGMISGFLVPPAGFSGRLGMIAYEGDVSLEGDVF